MYFSINNKKLRKTLSLAAAMVLMASVFAGCSKKEESTLPTDPPISMPTEAATLPTETQPIPTETEEVNEKMATVLNELYIRSSPSEQAPEKGKLYPGDTVEIQQVASALEKEWGRIYEPADGWICLDFVDWPNRPSSGESTPDDSQGEDNNNTPDDNNNTSSDNGNGSNTVVARGTVTGSNLNIRDSATTNGSKIVGSLKKGDKVEILEKKNNWGRIKQGWISLDYVKLDTNNNGGNTGNNGGNNNTTAKPDGGNGSTKVISRGVVYNTENLNIRAAATVDSERVGGLRGGDRVEILEKSGSWGRIKEGWISLGYVYIDGTGTGNNKSGTVTGSNLNIRSGPGTNYDVVGSLDEGDDVTILFRVTVGNTTWGNIKQGWISMDYVDLDDADDDDDEGDGDITWVGGDDDNADIDEGNGSKDVIASGIVTTNGLNIRSEADSDSKKVGSLAYGARVDILEKDGFWGRTKKGWINLDYVYEDGTGDGGDFGVVTAGLNIRSGPGTNYDVVGGLDEDDEIEILFTLKTDNGTWYNIEEGWISAKYVEDVD